MVRAFFITAFGLIVAVAAYADGASAKWPECYCTDTSGARVELGESICLTVDGRTYLARCQMVLNNPAWHEVASSCTVSLRDEPSGPDNVISLVPTVNG